MSRVYLDLDLGHPLVYQAALQEYHRGIEFAKTKAPIYLGHPIDLESSHLGLTECEKDILKQAYQDEGHDAPATFNRPPPLEIGRLIIDLYDEKELPKTISNFKHLIIGDKGMSKLDKTCPLHYKGIPFHRLVPDFIIQGGDITRKDGSGGDSIFQGKFNDEKTGLKHKFKKGTVAMANSGKNSNSSQFFITLTSDPSKLSKLNGKYVVFGEINEACFPLLDKLNSLDCQGEAPSQPLMISDCGIINES